MDKLVPVDDVREMSLGDIAGAPPGVEEIELSEELEALRVELDAASKKFSDEIKRIGNEHSKKLDVQIQFLVQP